MKQARAAAEAETDSSQCLNHLEGQQSLCEVKGPAWAKEVGDAMADEETRPAG
jgi:hypothetical protein